MAFPLQFVICGETFHSHCDNSIFPHFVALAAAFCALVQHFAVCHTELHNCVHFARLEPAAPVKCTACQRWQALSPLCEVWRVLFTNRWGGCCKQAQPT